MMWSENNITLQNMRSAYEKGGDIKWQTENLKLQVIWYSSMQDLKKETSGNM